MVKLCKSLGAYEKDMVPFEKYVAAALGLASQSFAARALFGGAQNIERVDRLVQCVAAQKGMRSDVIDEVVRLVDAQFQINRRAQSKKAAACPPLAPPCQGPALTIALRLTSP